MEKYRRALKKSLGTLLKLPHVTGAGYGLKNVGLERTKRPALIIFVEKKLPAAELRREQLVPDKINGLETDVIEIGRVRLLDMRSGRERPARPGVSIGHYKITAGTFGAVVKDKSTGERLILSNNHILANATDGRDGRAQIGDPVLQPGPHDGGQAKDRIAALLRFSPLLRSVQEIECPVAAAVVRAGNLALRTIRPNYELKMLKRYQGANIIDAAVARPDDPGLIDEQIMEIGRLEGVAETEPGGAVRKSGRTSGLSEGTVTALGVTLEVEIGENDKGWFTDQVVSDMLSRPGDSGSLVLDTENRAAGLLFAGSEKYTVFNRIDQVLSRLELEL
ncbi:hypothetical protein [Desulfotomaculum copahuensis]|uniref:Peptidase S7 domain-containing protein n=1 Tax=Desulfotomaculum copahuensis TaxID=1838280 RepID=A0A1B7LFR4_9FIRM|nr:hypothetical protein [Desulfotomaculum copahuensis]OAT82959.1 hypothetical protein A6M21_08350 [Desulfotomaculum copahuensis]